MRPVLEVGAREARRYTDLLDRRILVAALVVGVLIGALWPAVADQGVSPQEGIYTAAVEDGADLAPVVRADEQFTVVEATPQTRTTADLVITDEDVQAGDSQRSEAALARLATSSRQYTDRIMEAEEDEAAAFPVRIQLIFQPRTLDAASVTDGTSPQPSPDQPDTNGTPDGTADGSQDEPGAGTGGPSPDASQATLLPSQIEPPFPLRSLLLTFAYLIPLTFVGDLVGGSVFAERVRSRGTALLASPVGPAGLLAGKTLPYVLATVAIALATTWVLGAGAIGLAAALPIVAFSIVAAVLIGILAPSQRSLTFMLVSVNVMLSTFLFLPALFSEIPPVAYLSPVGLIAGAIRGEALTLGHLAYGTLPLWGITASLAILAVAMYREETLMAPGGGLSSVVDGLSRVLTNRRRLVLAGALAVPLALVLELFVLVFAVTLDLQLALVAFLIGGALVEELLKAAPAYSVYARERRAWAPPVVGGLIGLGFFVGEKATFGLSWLGFGTLPGGHEALATFGVASSVLLVLAPLVLHALTASMSAWGASEGRLQAVVGWLGAGLVHAVYNGTVLVLAGGGLPF